MILLLSLMNPLERFNRLVGWISSYLSILALALMVLIILLQVFCRYVLNNALPWPDEAARFLMLWFAGLMAPVGTIWHFKSSTCGDMELRKLYVNLSKVLHVTVRNKFWFDN